MDKVPGHLSKLYGLWAHLSPCFPFERVCVEGSLRMFQPTMSTADYEPWRLVSNGMGSISWEYLCLMMLCMVR